MRKMAGKCAAVLLAMVSLLSVFGCAANEGAYRGAETPEQEISMFLQAISDKEPKEELLKFFPVAWMAENYEVSHLPEQQAEKYRDPEFHLETFQTGLPVLIGSLFLNEEGTMAQGYELPDGFDPLGEGALDLLGEKYRFSDPADKGTHPNSAVRSGRTDLLGANGRTGVFSAAGADDWRRRCG